MTKTTRARALAGVLATLLLVCSFAPSVAATASDAASPAETERTAATTTATTTTATLTTTLDPVATIEARFDRWLATHGKAYACPKERAKRLAIFADNAEFVRVHNEAHAAGKKSHWLGLNHLADLTREEFKHMLGYDASKKRVESSSPPVDAANWEYADVTPPETMDWVSRGAVTPVKNQGQCGSCWAFSTVGAVEGVVAVKTGDLISLSEQELVSCAKIGGNNGCKGGLMDNGFEWIVENRGVDDEEDWGYLAKDRRCNWFKKRRAKAASIDGFKDVPRNDEDALKKAVSQQPVAVAIEADHREFQLYSGGVFDGECGTNLDHGVLVVGYGYDGESAGHKHYWTVKNSWGAKWGEEGYIRIARGGMGPAGQCGVAMQASYPTKSSSAPLEDGDEPTVLDAALGAVEDVAAWGQERASTVFL